MLNQSKPHAPPSDGQPAPNREPPRPPRGSRGRNGDTGLSARLLHPWVLAQVPQGGRRGADGGHVQRTPRKPRASWPRCKEPWKRATGKKIKRSLAETEQRRERGYNSLLILAGSRHRWEPAISLGCEPWGCEAAGGRGGGRNLLPALSRPHPCPLCCCSSGQDSQRGYSGKK